MKAQKSRRKRLSDEVFKKLSEMLNSLTGSLGSKVENSEKDSVAPGQNDPGPFDDSELFNQIFDALALENHLIASSGPGYMLLPPSNKESSHHWLYNVNTRTIDMVSPNVEVIPISQLGNDHMVCAVGSSEYKIPVEYLKCIGYH